MTTLTTSDGVRLHYVCSGADDAPRLVLLHGLGSDALGYDALVEALGDRLHVARVDLRGHGASEALADPARYGWFARAAADVVEVLDALGWDDAGIAGGSLGAATATAVALGYPERVARLGVFAPAFGAGRGGGNDAAAGLFQAISSTGLMGVLELLEALPEPMPEEMLAEVRANWGRQDDAAIRACVIALADAVLVEDLDELERVDMPTLIVGHRGDPLHPVEVAEAYAANLPHSRLVVFESSTDAVPARMAQLIGDFFSEL